MFIGSIYAGVSQAGGPPLKDIDVSAASFSGVFLNVLKWLMDNFQPGLNGTSALDSATEIAIHARNQRLLPLIEKSLKASEPFTVYPELKATIVTRGGIPSLVSEMATAMADCIVAQPNLFIGITGAFVGVFPCVYVPAADETGFLLKLVDTVNEEATQQVTTPSSMAFNAGSPYMLPLKGVVVTTAWPVVLQGLNETRFTEKMAAIYPEGVTNQTVLEGATFQKVGAPRWLPNVVQGVNVTGEKSLRELVEKKLDASSASVADRKKQSEALFTRDTKVTQALLNRYCRSQYYYLALAGARATLNLPLNFAFVPGNCYRIADTDDKGGSRPLFTGFVQSVTHRIKSDGGGEASTVVMLSHIRMEGFALPG
jgi:hypothetical protein